MIRIWVGTFVIPVLMLLYAALSALFPRALGYPRSLPNESKKIANGIFLPWLWKLAPAFAALCFMLMQSTRLMETNTQRLIVFAVMLAEALLAAAVVIPVERALGEQAENEPAETTVTEQAAAKVNLLLNVGRKREDGYHELVSVMQTVGVYDTLTVTAHTSGGIELSCDEPSLATDETNLCYKAAVKFFTYTGIENDGVTIDLQKRLPMQAGLGGGSADAAAVLRGLRRLYKPELSDAALETMAAELGSDVPFCVRGGTALARGRGEELTELPPLPTCWFVLVKPEDAFSTGKMYGLIDDRRCYDEGGADAILAALKAGDLKAVCAAMGNTFERTLPPDSEIFAIRQRLMGLGALGAMMSGSGSAVFGVFADEDRARMACSALRGTYPATFCGKSE